MDKTYFFEGEVNVSGELLTRIAEEFLEDEGPGKDWSDANNFIWDFYSGYENWDQVLDEITDDVFKIYEELTDKESEEE